MLFNIPVDSLRTVLTAKFGRKGEDVVKGNLAALDRGRELAAALKKTDPWTLGTPKTKQEVIVMSGNNAIGLGALIAGLDFYSAYPITPATEGGSRVKLDIGCGTQKRDEDYVGVDAHVEGADVKAEMWDLPYKDGEVDSIWSSHALEHAPQAKVSPTLKEWLRVLRPGGRLIVQVPNFDYVAMYWLTGPDRAWAEAMVFGHQAHEGAFHKSAFTSAILRADLEAAGFIVKRVEMRWTHSQETLQAVAVKPTEAGE